MELDKRRGHPPGQGPGTASDESNGFVHGLDPRSAYARDELQQTIANTASDWWSQGAMLAIRQLALSGRGFDADHLLDMVGQPTDSHFIGAVFSAAQRAKIIEPVGSRVARDGRLLRVWWGVRS